MPEAFPKPASNSQHCAFRPRHPLSMAPNWPQKAELPEAFSNKQGSTAQARRFSPRRLPKMAPRSPQCEIVRGSVFRSTCSMSCPSCDASAVPALRPMCSASFPCVASPGMLPGYVFCTLLALELGHQPRLGNGREMNSVETLGQPLQPVTPWQPVPASASGG